MPKIIEKFELKNDSSINGKKMNNGGTYRQIEIDRLVIVPGEELMYIANYVCFTHLTARIHKMWFLRRDWFRTRCALNCYQ